MTRTVTNQFVDKTILLDYGVSGYESHKNPDMVVQGAPTPLYYHVRWL